MLRLNKSIQNNGMYWNESSNVLKINGELKLVDGQSGKAAEIRHKGYMSFKYLKSRKIKRNCQFTTVLAVGNRTGKLFHFHHMNI